MSEENPTPSNPQRFGTVDSHWEGIESRVKGVRIEKSNASVVNDYRDKATRLTKLLCVATFLASAYVAFYVLGWSWDDSDTSSNGASFNGGVLTAVIAIPTAVVWSFFDKVVLKYTLAKQDAEESRLRALNYSKQHAWRMQQGPPTTST